MQVSNAAAGLSYADYLALERDTGVPHEFLRGDAWTLAGGPLRHSRLKVAVAEALRAQLRGSPCAAFDADVKVRVPDTGLTTYADSAVVCGPVRRDAEDGDALVNPILLVEVLAPPSEEWDRGGKLLHYRRLASLRHYLLVSVDNARVEHFQRGADGHFALRAFGPGSTLALPDLGVRIDVDALYAGLPESGEDAPGPSPRG